MTSRNPRQMKGSKYLKHDFPFPIRIACFIRVLMKSIIFSAERSDFRKIMQLLCEKLKTNPQDEEWMEFMKSRQFIYHASQTTNHGLLLNQIRDCMCQAARIVCIEQRKFEVIRLLPATEFFKNNSNYLKLQECFNGHLNLRDRKFLNVILT